MKKGHLIGILMWMAFAFPAQAQNSIDRLVEEYSTSGPSVFTSAVERDPQTRKVVKVVNVLEVKSQQITPFVRAFEREKSTANVQTSIKNGESTVVLTCERNGFRRIYMLQRRSDPRAYIGGKVTIIIKSITKK